ncbi:MAG: protein kinase, partial [Gemmatimonadota bacterium]
MSVSPEQWTHIKQVFQQALPLAAAEREELLRTACAGDARLREEVESLLASHDEAGPFLEESAFVAAAGALREALDSAPPRIGAYRVVREIGRGGMGTVYLAERDDGEYVKQVAVKVISRGMDSDAIIRRFWTERQILAGLDHPHIARLLDGGALEDGRPYFVLEHIEGEPIDRYAAARGLGTDDRLKLFCATCAAVQYAHAHLIVHRDLKPGNILVTPEGVPKLLDFGLAKLLDPGADAPAPEATLVSAQGMTPEYASPEQVRGEPLTTASDVYSLGVVLYQLLTGRHPKASATRRRGGLARAVTDPEPARPSTVVPEDARRRRLRGDLDTIVLKALRQEPAQRYASVEQLTDDLCRHQQGLPVLARPSTFRYRSGKFLQRHRIAVAAAALLLVTLVGGIATTTWQRRVAETERARAERRFDELRQLARLFIFDYNEAVGALPGSTPLRERMIRDGFAYLNLLASEAGDDPSLQRELAEGFGKIGEVQARLGDIAGSLRSHRRALALQRAQLAADPDDVGLQRTVAATLALVADRQTDTGDAAAALAAHREALRLRQRIAASLPQDPAAQSELLYSDFYVGRALLATGDYEGALAAFDRMLTRAEALRTAEPGSVERAEDALTAHHAMAAGRLAVGDLAAATRGYRQALALAQQLSAADSCCSVANERSWSSTPRAGFPLRASALPRPRWASASERR